METLIQDGIDYAIVKAEGTTVVYYDATHNSWTPKRDNASSFYKQDAEGFISDLEDVLKVSGLFLIIL